MTSADHLFQGGPVFSGWGAPLEGYAVAVTNGRITAVVPDHEAARAVGSDTEVVDLGGALLSPGFQDAHVHPVSGGTELLTCDLTSAIDARDAVERVAAYAKEHPEAPWILGGGWSMEHFDGGAPTRQLIDSVVADRPVLLSSRDHHSAWVNTAAITIAGLDSSTPDPVDGRIEREPDGSPAGTFHEGAERMFDAVRPAIDPDFAYRGLLRAQRALIEVGITGWQDAMVGGGVSGVGNVDELYRRAVTERALRVHVVGAQWWERDSGLEQVDEIVQRRKEILDLGAEDRYSLGTVKIMVDGIAENHTAAMLAPYRDRSGHDCDNRGLSFIPPERLCEIVTELDRLDFQVHFHAVGDRAAREALDAIEAARGANGPSDNRHHIAHLQVLAEPDTARFEPLGAVANLQALWACHEEQLDELTLPYLQDGEVARQYPFGDLVRHRARLAAGSDWPVSSPDPVQALHVAVNRVAPGRADVGPLGGAHQRLDLATAMAAYTSGSAYVNHREHDTGSVRAGYVANLVTLDPNPFALPAAEVHEAAVTSTWIDGQRIDAPTTQPTGE